MLPPSANNPMVPNYPPVPLPQQGPMNAALVPSRDYLPAGAVQAMAPPGVGSAGAINVFSLLRAFQRRMTLALSLGLLAAVLVGVVAWFALPLFLPSSKGFKAQTKLHINPGETYIVNPQDKGGRSFAEDPMTRLVMVRSRLVLNAALRHQEVSELPYVKNQVEPVVWLEKEIKADYVTGEIMTITLTGEDPDVVRLVVKAITAAYIQEIVNRERNIKHERLANLKDMSTKYEQSVANKRKVLKDMIRAAPVPVPIDHKAQNLRIQFAESQLGDAKKALFACKRDLQKIQVEFAASEARQKVGPDMVIPDAHVEEELNKDPVIATSARRINELDALLARAKGVLSDKDPLVVGYKKEREELLQTIFNRKKETRRHVVKRLRDGARSEADNHAFELAAQMTELRQLEKYLEGYVNELIEMAREIQESSIDLSELQGDIDGLLGLIKGYQDQQEALKVELGAPPRMTVLEDAVVTPWENWKKQITIMGASSLVTFGCVVFGITWWEWRAKRISTMDEVHGLGMRLIGTLPALPDRRRRALIGTDGSTDHYWNNLMTESVDATRTMILHAAQAESLRVLMVTSALGGEGKTSLSSHLAASFARAGRRTIIVDCDLRRPSVHLLFDMPSEPGICDLLRGEGETADYVQTTPLSGLSLLAAGRCDTRALQGLAQGGLQAIFDALKEQFDFIVVDSAPVLPVADSLQVGQHTDAVVFSVLREVSRTPAVYAAYHRMASLGMRMLGAIVNGAKTDSYGYGYYHYGYGYGYGYGRPMEPEAPPADAAGESESAGEVESDYTEEQAESARPNESES